MPATDAQLLYGLGPFAGEMPGRPDVFIPVRPFTQNPTNVQQYNNIDVNRFHGAATTAYGRVPFQTFPQITSNAGIMTLLRFDTAPEHPFWIALGTGNRLVYYDWANNVQIDNGNISAAYTMGVQCDGQMYLNDGTQLYLKMGGKLLGQTMWQFEPFSGTPVITKVPFNPGLAQQKYYYAFTIITTITTDDGPIVQESAPVGATAPYPYFRKVVDNNTALQIAGLGGGGVNADGTSFKIGIYRLSDNQPNWFRVTQTQNNTYVDSATDQSISSNPELTFAGSEPPVAPNALWPIGEYLDRMWIFAIVQNANTNNVPQTQLWYSAPGQGWQFDAVAQVLTVGNEATPPNTNNNFVAPPVYGAEPVALTKFGSLFVAWRQGDSWFVTGQDENTFQVIPLFDSVGCMAQFGPVVGRGMMCWPADSGYWSFDGATLNYISDDIFEAIQAMAPSDYAAQVGFYWNNYFCWSYPTLQFTWMWHQPTQQWYQLPYALTSVATTRTQGPNAAIPNDSAAGLLNQVVGVRQAANGNASNIIDSWFADPVNDLGLPIVGTVIGPYSDGGIPHATKTLRWVVLDGPPQPGAKVQVTINRDFGYQNDTGSQSSIVLPEFDLGSQYPWVIQIPDNQSQATYYSMNLTLTPAAGGTNPIQLWKAEIYGDLHRSFAIPNPGMQSAQ